jgi:hypothetical protein
MAGLNLMGMGGARVTGGYTGGNASTASQSAFGSGVSTGNYPSNASALAPNDPFGVALWTSVVAVGLLLLIRHSLPN